MGSGDADALDELLGGAGLVEHGLVGSLCDSERPGDELHVRGHRGEGRKERVRGGGERVGQGQAVQVFKWKRRSVTTVGHVIDRH
jgi:hypothetical protein